MKKINIIYSIISLLIIVASYFINSIFFRDAFLKKFSESIFWLTVPVLCFSLITIFLKTSTFNAWRKLTNYFYLISLLIILITPTSTHGLDFVPFVKETVTILLAIIYSVVSIFLIIFKSLKKE